MHSPEPLIHPKAQMGRSRPVGFTLIEMIVSLVVLALLAVVMVPLLSLPSTAYMDARRRTDIQNHMELLRSKLLDDLRYAMPGSLRRTNSGTVEYLEYLETRGYARYLNGGGCGGPVHSFMTGGCPITDFDTLGPITYLSGAVQAISAPNGDYVAVPSGVVNPYSVLAGQRAMVRLTSATPLPNGVRLAFTANSFPTTVQNASLRAYIVVQPVSYVCDPTAHTLTKFWGYAFTSGQPTFFSPAVSKALILGQNVNTQTISSCKFGVDPPPPASPPPVPIPGAGQLRSVVSLAVRLTTPAAVGQPQESMDGFIQVGVREP